MNTRILSTELCCPICLDLLTSTMTTKECLHRFCSDCITTALMRGNKECPTCRKKIVSKRSLRPDPNFDFLINKIWPDRKLYEKMQDAALKHFHQQNSVKALQKSIEEGLKAQAANRRIRIQGSYDYESILFFLLVFQNSTFLFKKRNVVQKLSRAQLVPHLTQMSFWTVTKSLQIVQHRNPKHRTMGECLANESLPQ